MKMMKEYTYDCLSCGISHTATRSIRSAMPRFCSNKCYRLASPKWLVRKKFSELSDSEKAEHLHKYFERNVIKGPGCWDWVTKRGNDKYVRMNHCRTEPRISIHVYSWKVNFGDIPQGMIVCHKCDNLRCSNPKHLFLVTSKNNSLDGKEKRRSDEVYRNPEANLNENQVSDIKKLIEMGVPVTRIAKSYKMEASIIYKIKQKKAWAHVI